MQKTFAWYVLLYFLFLDYSNSAKILVLHVHDERSHLFSMAPFLKRLSEDGHELTIFDSCSILKSAKLDFNSSMIHAYLPTNLDFEDKLSKVLWLHDVHSFISAINHKFGDNNMGELILHAAEKFVEIFKNDYNLVIVDEVFSIHGMTIAKILKELKGIPYICFTTANIAMESNMAELALGYNPVVDSNFGTSLPLEHGDIYDSKIFGLRAYNFLQTIGEYFVLYFLNPIILTYKNPSKLMIYPFSTHEIIRNAEMNFREGMDLIGPILPHAVDFRGIGSHCKLPAPELNGELKDFVEDSESKGTIYIAFGSLVNFDKCPQFIFDAFFKALDEFSEYRIIFSMKKLKSRHLPKIKNHVKIVSWAPQLAILGHHKTKLFIFKEALCTKTPIVFLPTIAEQGTIARMSMKLGIGTSLNKFTLTSEKMIEAFNMVLRNASYK